MRKGDAVLRVTACPGRHGPGVTDLVLPDVMGSVIEMDVLTSPLQEVLEAGEHAGLRQRVRTLERGQSDRPAG